MGDDNRIDEGLLLMRQSSSLVGCFGVMPFLQTFSVAVS